MATLAIDTSQTREAGLGSSPIWDGLNGKVVGFSFSGLTNGLIFNTGFGVQWVMWENTTWLPGYSSTSAQTVAAIHDGVDRVTFTFSAGGPFSGTLWCFYRQGAGDGRSSTGGTTATPTGVVEYCSRRAQRCRLTSWTSTTMTAAQSVTSGLSGVQAVGTRALSTDTNSFDVRFTSEGNHGSGRVTVGATAASRSGHTVFFSTNGKGLDSPNFL